MDFAILPTHKVVSKMFENAFRFLKAKNYKSSLKTLTWRNPVGASAVTTYPTSNPIRGTVGLGKSDLGDHISQPPVKPGTGVFTLGRAKRLGTFF